MNHIPLHLVRQIISSYVHDHLENLRGVVLNPVASTPAFGDLRVVVLNPVASTPAFSHSHSCVLYPALTLDGVPTAVWQKIVETDRVRVVWLGPVRM